MTRWQFWDVAHWDPTCAVFIFEHVVKPVVLKSGEPNSAAIAKGSRNQPLAIVSIGCGKLATTPINSADVFQN